MSGATITRYLLGSLEEEEQDRLEQQYFADPEMLALVEATEDDLIDAYIRGELSLEDRARFESHFLRSRRRRERVSTAEALLARMPSKSSRAPVWYALAASLVLLFALWRTGTGDGKGSARTSGTDRTNGTTVADRRPVVPVPAVARTAVTLALTPGVTRDDSGGPPRLDLTGQADDVVLTPVTEAEGPLSAVLRLGEKEIWSAANLTPPLRLTIPAQRFVPGDYLLTVRDSQGEVVDDYIFSVTR